MIGLFGVPALVLLGPASPEVTVYYQGFGLIKEVHTLSLKAGRQSIEIADVPSMIDLTSVAIRSLTAPGSFLVLEQNYRYDLVSVRSILEKSVGRKVGLIRHFNGKREELDGTLLSPPDRVAPGPAGQTDFAFPGMAVRVVDGRIILNPVGEVVVPALPDGLTSRPTLEWNLDCHRAGANRVELSYIANGIKWTANYVLSLSGESGSAMLQGWVDLDNRSGGTFKNARLKLLAGDVHVAVPRTVPVELDYANAARIEVQQLFEYHLYTLMRPVTIHNNETKQLSLLAANRVPYRERLVFDSLRDHGEYYPSQTEIGGGTMHPQVRIEFVDDAKSGLGIPLPAGKFRIYERDQSGSVQLLGEDAIQHTPRNERVSLLAGTAFDVVANRKRLSFHVVGPNAVREVFEIDVRNHKTTPATVELLERHYGDWVVESQNVDGRKVDANTLRYELRLKADKARKVTYTVFTRW